MHMACAVLSFDRPGYLKATLLSLLASMRASNVNIDVYLFQDGWKSRFDHAARAERGVAETCINGYRAVFPRGQVVYDEMNWGVALNFHRAEALLFEKMGYDCVLFFEDDLTVDPRYLRILTRMVDIHGGDPRVGVFACYGADHTMPVSAQRLHRNRLTALTHFWGYAMMRSTYEKRKSIVSSYVALLEDIEYMNKGQKAQQIHALQQQLGFDPHVISQDMFKCMALHSLGMVNVNTEAVFARYIGVVGMHSDEMHYKQEKYQHTQIYPLGYELPEITRLSDDRFLELRQEQEDYIRRSRPQNVGV